MPSFRLRHAFRSRAAAAIAAADGQHEQEKRHRADRIEHINERESGANDEQSADGRPDDRTDLKDAAVPGHRVRERVARHQLRKIRTARGPPERPGGRRAEQDQINQRDGKIVEMEIGVALEDGSDGIEKMISALQEAPVWNREVLPGNVGQRHGANRAQRLRHEHDPFSRKAICDMAGRQREQHDRQRDHQPDEPERRGRMRARIHFPLHRHHEHQAANDGDEISRGVETEISKTKRRIGIMFSARPQERALGRGGTIRPRGLVGRNGRVLFAVWHLLNASAFTSAQEIVEALRSPATQVMARPRPTEA